MCRKGYIHKDVCIARLANLIPLVLRRNFENQLYSGFPSCQNMMAEMWNSLHRLRDLNTLVLFVGYRKCSLDERSVLLGGGLWKFIALSHFQFILFASFQQMKESYLSFLLLSSRPLLASMLPHRNGQLPLWNCQPKETLSSVSLLWSWCFNMTTERPQYIFLGFLSFSSMEVTYATSAFFLYFLRGLFQLSLILLLSKSVFLIGRRGEKDKGKAAITELDIITK